MTLKYAHDGDGSPMDDLTLRDNAPAKAAAQVTEYEKLCDRIVRTFPQDIISNTRDVDQAVDDAAYELTRLREFYKEMSGPWADDRPGPFDAEIERAHPARLDNDEPYDHERYVIAMKLVGTRNSKYALVDLVNWLIKRAEIAGRDRPGGPSRFDVNAFERFDRRKKS